MTTLPEPSARIQPTPSQIKRVRDLKGHRFGRIIVVRLAYIKRTSRWECRCDCGTTKIVRGHDLVLGKIVSCGCWKNEKLRERRLKHGMSHSTEWDIHHRMLQQCHNPRNRQFADYGGRGIRVCKRWRKSFIHFLEDMGRRPSRHHSLDRIDNDGNYEPSNCRWATRAEQHANKRNSIIIEHNGLRLSLKEWSEKTGLNRATIKYRLSHGWPISKAMTVPAGWGVASEESKSKGVYRIPEYRIWIGMRQRCFNQNNRAYERYGGRGITVCDRWLGKDGFRNFVKDMGVRPSTAHSLDRIDNNGNYSPSNCRWATNSEQIRNRSITRNFEFCGEVLCLEDLAKRFAISSSTISRRLRNGWNLEDAVSIPPDEFPLKGNN